MLIVIVLLQQGKGADAGATFGGGGNTVFGSAGADNFLTKITTFIAISFMCTSVYLAMDAKDARANKGSLIDSLPSSLPIQDSVTSGENSEEADATNEAPAAVPNEAAVPTEAVVQDQAAAAKATVEQNAPVAEESVAEVQKTEDSPSK
jgi:preprotein translocase subunit SecG